MRHWILQLWVTIKIFTATDPRAGQGSKLAHKIIKQDLIEISEAWLKTDLSTSVNHILQLLS